MKDLSSAETKNDELGAKWNVIPDFNLALSIFDSTESNVVQRDANTGLGTKIGEQERKGVELSFTGTMTEKLSLMGDAYSDSKMLDGLYKGNTAALAPKNMAMIWAKYQIDPMWYVAVEAPTNSMHFRLSSG